MISHQNQQKLETALAEINKSYRGFSLGCVDYYQSFEGNRWDSAHADLEQALLSNDQVLIANKISIFSGTIIKLIHDYRAIKRRMNHEQQA